MNLESLAKKTTAQREHPPSRFKSFKTMLKRVETVAPTDSTVLMRATHVAAALVLLRESEASLKFQLR